MYLTITQAARKKIMSDFEGSKDELLLDFDDGVGAFSRVGVCSLDSVFRILIVSKETEIHDYDKVIDSDLGPFKIKGYSEMYMDDEMKLDVNEANQMLRLTGANSGELTAAVRIERIAKQQV
ncbi:iron-sulfur cluster biosynthesis family protein [Liquorilactobacillus capillatus]|uniref:Core domain-containing protein n=1 Tax=Liquorilactobacillus capillatus DSM 19910 TaxID=1423731 RepID=A0A0R1LWU4_9LACO|nr:iron-sulfur cluster biosynthesis family protein [Liquorilactobacillus capillatus]KRL00078.1 hypothetical protein FC81_GL000455 [Liquorilactobacillus capillatus DSM 19910]